MANATNRRPLPPLLVACLIILAVVVPPTHPSGAAFTASTTNAASGFTADTLTPPTSVSGTANASQVVLSWTPTADTYATGYRVFRSLSPSSGYTLVATVAGRASTGYTDPYVATQTTYYRVRAYRLSWSSVDSNTATVQPGYAQTVLGTAGLVSYWRLGAGTTSTVVPDSKGTNTGTASGGFTPGVAGAISDDTAASFNGSTGKVNIGNPADLRLWSGSIEVWFRTANAGTGYRELVSRQSAYGLALRDNVLGFWDDDGGGWKTTGLTLNDNQWHHVVMTFQSGVTNGTRIYLDGALVLTDTLNIKDQTKNITIGAWNAEEFFAGTLDEVAIYSTVLSAATVLAHFNAR